MWLVLGTLAFGLEVVAWIALGCWGWQAGSSPPMRWLLAVLAPLLFMAFWGVFLSPKASIPISVATKSVLQLTVFAIAAWAAAQVWGRPFAIGFYALAVATLSASLIAGGQP